MEIDEAKVKEFVELLREFATGVNQISEGLDVLKGQLLHLSYLAGELDGNLMMMISQEGPVPASSPPAEQRPPQDQP